MATYSTLRGSSAYYNDGFVQTGAASTLAALTDSLDTSYIRKPNSSNGYSYWAYVANPATSLPAAGTFYVGARTLGRISQGSGGNLDLWCFHADKATSPTATYDTITNTTGTQTVPATGATVSTASRASTGVITVTTAAAHTYAVDDLVMITGSTTGTPSNFVNATYRVVSIGASTFTAQDIRGAQAVSTVNATNGNVSLAWNVATPWCYPFYYLSTSPNQINNLEFGISDNSTASSRAYVYEVFTEVWTSPIPTTSITSIDLDTVTPFVVTTTSRPTIEWSYAQADGLAQHRSQLKIFTTSQATPDTPSAAPVWSTDIYSATSTATVSTDLLNGTTYYLYVKTGTSGLYYSGTDDTDVAWSSWASLTFTTSYTAPTAPTVSPVWNSTPQTVSLTLTGAAVTSPMTAQTFDVQRSDNGGTTWYFVRSGTSLAPNGSYVVTLTDYEAARGTTVQYRARSIATGAGSTLASQWSTAATLSVPSLTTWTLRSLSDTTQLYAATGVQVLADLEITQEETVGVFRPQGRTVPIVVHGTLQGRDGSLTILANGQTAFDNLLNVINGQENVLVADPFGEKKYIQVTGRSWSKTGAGASPRYTVNVSYVEVASGLTAGT